MEAKDAIKDVKNGRISPVYVLYGKDRYRMKQFTELLTDKLLGKDERELGIIKFDTSETSLEEIIGEAETLPFFVEHKLLIVRDASVMCNAVKESSKIEHRVEAFLSYMQQPSESSVIVFMVQAEKLDERRKIVKLLKERNLLMPFPELSEHELKNWLQRRAVEQKRTMTDEAAQMLIVRTGTSMQALSQEADKLCLFVGEGGTIGEKDVHSLTASTVEEDVFALIDAMAEQKISRTLQLYHELLKRREEPIRIAALVARQLRIMLQIKELENQRYSQQQMAGTLGLHPYAVKLSAEKTRRFQPAFLGKRLGELAELDYKMKTGRVDKILGLELFFLSMAESSVANQ